MAAVLSQAALLLFNMIIDHGSGLKEAIGTENRKDKVWLTNAHEERVRSQTLSSYVLIGPFLANQSHGQLSC